MAFTFTLRRALFLSITFCLFCGLRTASEPTSPEIVQRMFSTTRQIRSMSYGMKKTERIDGRLMTQVSQVKMQRSPLKVYMRQMSPEEGLEVLYVQGENGNNALVNTNGFPYVNLSLDPFGSIMRKGQHHTVMDAGYDHFISILDHLITRYGPEAENMLTLETESWKGQACYKVEFNNPNFKIVDYTVQAGENIESISRKFKISSYMMLELNPSIDDHLDVVAGQKIKISNDYSPRLVLYIERARNIPVYFTIYDHQGVFEQYEYFSITLNPKIEEGEFTRSYPGYSF